LRTVTVDPAKTKVILVGNSVFPNWGTEDKSILNAEANIEQLQKIFSDNSFFGIPDDNKHLIPIINETSQTILLQIKKETKSAIDKGKYERLIFYYCGHGIPGEDSKLFLASKDTVRDDYEITSVDSHRLFSYLKSFGARELIVILDCCYAAQTKENLGDSDSLIAQCLPEESAKQDDPEASGVYYLFAAGKDNVAKFNPKEPKKPTYFTEALLNSINAGVGPQEDYIKMGELYKQLRTEIGKLRVLNPDIPDPRPGLEGDVNDFLFCKNIKYENQEDKDWEIIRKNPTLEEIRLFLNRHSESKYAMEANDLRIKIMDGWSRISTAEKTNDFKAISQIAKEFKDIPAIWRQANKLLDKASAAYEGLEQQVLSDKIEKSEELTTKSKLVSAAPPVNAPIRAERESQRITIEAPNNPPEALKN